MDDAQFVPVGENGIGSAAGLTHLAADHVNH
jgi:hypothetical protein